MRGVGLPSYYFRKKQFRSARAKWFKNHSKRARILQTIWGHSGGRTW